MLFCCLWHNVETSCHKHFAVLARHHQTPPLTTSDNLRDGGPTASYWQHLAGSSVNSTHWSQILAQNRDFCLPHLHSTPSLWGFPSEYCHDIWCRKNRIAWLPDGEKISKISLFVLTECTNPTDTHTHTQTSHDDIGCALHSIAWQKSLFSTNISLHLRNDTRYGHTEYE